MSVRLLAAASALVAMTACAGVPKPEGPAVASAADLHRITVTESADRLNLPVSAADITLTPQTISQLDQFAEAYVRNGHGPVILSAPSGGANADAAARLAQQARMRLVEAGVPYAAIAGSTYEASAAGDAPLVLTFTRYDAEAPHCAPVWTQDLAHQSNNQAYATFGCANTANLAAMIEDPHDLLGPRDETARDGGRRAAVLSHYRAGESTAAVRSSDERITISSAVQ